MTDQPETPPAAKAETLSPEASSPAGTGDYRVLARKYRPTNFETLIGQDALVRTLSNAFETGRIAHAFLLTGVRGVGKTTTARIIARALNCIGPDGQGGPTITPCGLCSNCQAIAEDRHVDVIEMDAASRTGVNDIREIIESVRYMPVQARYKVYIIDEVHMLSTAAFNALLKTLEEPPSAVKFIFATTEIRKVPVTVLSRCQKFDLRRVESTVLTQHFATICEKENAKASEGGLRMIAQAADGSVRDGLSLLDQAIILGDGHIEEDLIRDMLGLAHRDRVFALLDHLFAGRVAEALEDFTILTKAGGDPQVILQDLLDLIHMVTRLKVIPKEDHESSLPELERTRGQAMADALSIPLLTRAWQICLKGLSEVQQALRPHDAAEMLLIRLAFAADLPDPTRLIRTLKKAETNPITQGHPSQGTAQGTPQGAGPGGSQGGPQGANPPQGTASHSEGSNPQALFGAGSHGHHHAPQAMAPRLATTSHHYSSAVGTGLPSMANQTAPEAQIASVQNPHNYEALVEIFKTKGEIILSGHLTNNVRLVSFRQGFLEINLGHFAPADIPGKVGQMLTDWTGQRWVVSTSTEKGDNTLSEQKQSAWLALKEQAAAHDLVKTVFKLWPGAEILKMRQHEDQSLPTPLPDSPDNIDAETALQEDIFEENDLIDW